jgi:hypothetical protein
VTAPECLWTRIKSWHLSPVVLPAGYPAGKVPTLCGRQADGRVARVENLLMGDPTCESCFRVREARSK